MYHHLLEDDDLPPPYPDSYPLLPPPYPSKDKKNSEKNIIKKNRKNKIIYNLIICLFVLINIAIVCFFYWKYSMFMKNLPHTNVTIINTTINEKTDCDHSVNVSYNFTHEEHVYYGNFFPMPHSCVDKDPQLFANAYPPGSNVTVYWYPGNIHRNSLSKESLDNQILLACIIVSGVVMIVLILSTISRLYWDA